MLFRISVNKPYLPETGNWTPRAPHGASDAPLFRPQDAIRRTIQVLQGRAVLTLKHYVARRWTIFREFVSVQFGLLICFVSHFQPLFAVVSKSVNVGVVAVVVTCCLADSIFGFQWQSKKKSNPKYT